MSINQKKICGLIIKILLFLSPLANWQWTNFITQISPFGVLNYVGGKGVLDHRGIIGLCVDLFLFFIVVNMLFQYLYLILINTLKSRYKVVTLCFVLLSLSSIVLLDYIFAEQQRTIAEYSFILLTFIPFYVVVYLLRQVNNTLANIEKE